MPLPELAEWHLNRAYRGLDATRPDVRVARLAADQWGVVDLDDLRWCGLSQDGVERRVRSGHLHPLHKRVFAVGHTNLPQQARILAAVKACGAHAFGSRFAAGELYARIVLLGDRRPDVLVLGATTRRHPEIRVHRTTRLDPRDVTRCQGIPVTTPARTLVDLAADLTYDQLRRATREAQAQRLVTLPQLVETLARLRPCRGAVNLARIVAGGPAPTRSELEDVVLDLILRGGLRHPDVNVPIRVGGRRIVPDFRWPEQRLVVEADGARYHDGEVAREDDAERQALLEAAGERVLRVRWEQAVCRESQTLRRIRAAGAPSG
jgi:very-short-patch-repair endonuclease